MKARIATALMLGFALSATADIIPIPIDIGRGGKPVPPPPTEGPHRIPFRLVIEAEYDNEQHELSIHAAPNMRAEVFVYDEAGNCIGHATEMNTTLTLAGPSLFRFVRLKAGV